MIKLKNFPYKEHEVGDVVDLGEEKNRSMVDLGRAVFVGKDAEKTVPKPIEKKVEVVSEEEEATEIEIKTSDEDKSEDKE